MLQLLNNVNFIVDHDSGMNSDDDVIDAVSAGNNIEAINNNLPEEKTDITGVLEDQPTTTNTEVGTDTTGEQHDINTPNPSRDDERPEGTEDAVVTDDNQKEPQYSLEHTLEREAIAALDSVIPEGQPGDTDDHGEKVYAESSKSNSNNTSLNNVNLDVNDEDKRDVHDDEDKHDVNDDEDRRDVYNDEDKRDVNDEDKRDVHDDKDKRNVNDDEDKRDVYNDEDKRDVNKDEDKRDVMSEQNYLEFVNDQLKMEESIEQADDGDRTELEGLKGQGEISITNETITPDSGSQL